ncbi:Sulfotransferase family protein [Sphingomonas sp. YR710]|uniref:sulfotransferase family protein n=1 Tax=Sphingomonas sp. YR710 TaxID=1882773 RepID=UPI000886A45D|nr:sulfotransferase [Sphingomonas sp. YR710]SDD69873.1 Sulfotransferase family protein [Sphingomonas sp. YR710]
MTDEVLFAPPTHFVDAGDRLHELVAKRVGSSDFGGDDYRWGLRILLQSIDNDARFNAVGRQQAWTRLIEMLSGRARAVQSMAAHPGFERMAIRRPIVITGLPRTGTTALHKLLAVDPQFQGLEGWLLNAPMPRPPRDTWESYPQFREAVEQIARRDKLSPGAKAAHARAAEDVDECLTVLAHSFVSNMWASGWPAPTYDAWWQSQSEWPAYQHLHRVIQLIGSGEPDKRWLLKNPGHISNLDLLFKIFPDALVIQTHRDPARAIPSLTALLCQLYAPLRDGDGALQGRITAHRETEKWAKAVEDCERVRRGFPGQVMDIIQSDLHHDPIGTVKRIYDFCGLELSDEVENAMRQRGKDDPERSHGRHRYDIADFGLTEDEVRERFGSYVDRYDLRPKRALA